ncbi:MBL fold metallo-hydrolase [Sphingomonas changnyeongensis]|uniref:MBL fold metallo-hydrolase n=1 Tax=Sphingomonas changnyeongensis TaxID=2698679 RepID=A0A7Z2NXL3_9SPHN|nr:MBL fold metallo-hydrolase [Sphingomonas changnyeongensis]QHL91240.1 MBL fold metallo-hydrolase [Sphingomonas changnyeongensis]
MPGRWPECRHSGIGRPDCRGARRAILSGADRRAATTADRCGAGAALRLGEAGVAPAALDAIAISHLHVDHAGDLAAILKTSNFADPPARLTLFGPDGSGVFAGISAHMTVIAGENGAFAYLADWLAEPAPRLAIREIAAADIRSGAEKVLITGDDYVLSALPVHHGPVPALAYLVRAGGRMIVFAGDQSALSSGFEARLAGSRPDLLIMHHAIPEGPGQPRGLHRPPADIGAAAARLMAKRLILTHNMARALVRRAEGLAAIARHYPGPVTIADDKACFSASAGD